MQRGIKDLSSALPAYLGSPLIDYEWKPPALLLYFTVDRAEAVIAFRLRVLRVSREQQLQGCSKSKADLERRHTQTRPGLAH
jgi:hypothetical protein